MLIRNYGLFWKLEDVFWGRPNVRGHLKGRPSNNVTADPIDFREQQGVYVLYDDNFRLLYVGQAGAGVSQRLFTRLKQHTTDNLAERWTKFSWFGVRGVENDGSLLPEALEAQTTNISVLNHIEAILISASEPPHNRQGGRFGSEVTQYLQFRDQDELGPSLADMLWEIWEARNSE